MHFNRRNVLAGVLAAPAVISFSRLGFAAQNLKISQPSLSESIRSLTALLEKQGKAAAG